MKEKLIELIADLKLNEAEELADQLIKEGIAVQELYDLVMEGLAEIGKKYENGECYIADLIVSGMIAKNIFAAANLKQGTGPADKSLGTVLFGTIFDDIHDIGKDLMIDALENRSIHVIDLGVDVRVSKFVEAVKRHQPDIIAVSCVMTNSIPYLQELDKALSLIKPPFSREQRETVEAMSQAIVNKILHAPITEMKRTDRQGDASGLVQAVRRLFSLQSGQG